MTVDYLERAKTILKEAPDYVDSCSNESLGLLALAHAAVDIAEQMRSAVGLLAIAFMQADKAARETDEEVAKLLRRAG